MIEIPTRNLTELDGSPAEAYSVAAALYGHELAYKTLADIAFWLEAANSYLMPDDPENNLRINFSFNTAGEIEASFAREKGIKLTLPFTHTETTPSQVAHAVFHEAAHSAWWRASRKKGLTYRPTIFECVIDEGRATYAEQEVFDVSLAKIFTHPLNMTQVERQKMDLLLAELLFYKRLPNTGGKSSRKIKEYLFRDNNLGYRMGHLIVSGAAEKYGLTLEEAVGSPNELYREYAERYL